MTYAIRKTERGEQWWLCGFSNSINSYTVNWSTDKRLRATAENEDDAQEVLDYAKAFDAGAAPDTEYEIVQEAV